MMSQIEVNHGDQSAMINKPDSFEDDSDNDRGLDNDDDDDEDEDEEEDYEDFLNLEDVVNPVPEQLLQQLPTSEFTAANLENFSEENKQCAICQC